jgi:hypothetical protein
MHDEDDAARPINWKRVRLILGLVLAPLVASGGWFFAEAGGLPPVCGAVAGALWWLLMLASDVKWRRRVLHEVIRFLLPISYFACAGGLVTVLWAGPVWGVPVLWAVGAGAVVGVLFWAGGLLARRLGWVPGAAPAKREAAWSDERWGDRSCWPRDGLPSEQPSTLRSPPHDSTWPAEGRQ